MAFHMKKYRFQNWIINLLLCTGVLTTNNYPNKKHPKPCVRLLNVINIQVSLCVPKANGGFENKTEDNCRILLKRVCPEFNRAECTTRDVQLPESDSKTTLNVCKLSYHATGYTWFEAMFANYFYAVNYQGKKSPDFIVEVYRRIKRHETFGKRDQNDFPESVSDPKGERGLQFSPLEFPSPLPPEILTLNFDSDISKQGILCKGRLTEVMNETDNRCSTAMVNYVKQTNPTLVNSTRFGVTDFTGQCIHILSQYGDETIRWPACQVLLSQRTTADKCVTAFVYQEINLYFYPDRVKYPELVNISVNSTSTDDFRLRYAAWPETDPNLTAISIDCS